MSKKLSRSDALENISTWSTNDVLSLLRKNGLEECCTAVSKRQIDGDELLHLTEGKLTLWKSDLTSYLIRELLTFVEKIKKFPEKFVQEKNVEMEQNEDHMSDTSSWDTDFEDEIPEDNTAFTDTRNINVNQINSNYEDDRTISKKMKVKNVNANAQVDDNTKRQDEETTYVNFESTLDAGKVYVNYQDNLTNLPQKNLSRLHGTIEKTLAEQLKEQLQLRNSKKPVLKSKPEILISKRIPQVSTICKQPQKSFLHDESKTKTRPPNDVQKRMAVPPPPAPKKNADQSSQRIGKNDASKPSISIRNLDLIANLPTRQDKSEDEYEKFDKQIMEQNQKSIISKIDSKQSLNSGSQSSVESVYQPSSTTSCEDEEEPYEIYESITETPEDDDNYLSPIKKSSSSGDPLPPPLPVKLPTTLPLTFHRTKSNNAANERSPEKKSATLPHSGSSTSLLSERATRPLPPPPDRLSYVEKPWFHNVTREQAIILITEQGTYGNSQDDGYFLLRPSTTNVNSPLALVLWCRDRVYNIPVRKRSDNRYALGSVKVNETSFSSVEEIVTCYMKEELVLYTGGVQTGSTKLTGTPLK